MYWLLTLCLTQAWQPGAPMPTPGYGFACAAIGDSVFAIGGLTGDRDSIMPRPAVEAYDASRDTWITGFAPLPISRFFVGGVALDGKIYIVGGTDGWFDYCRVDRFDPATNTWDTVAHLPWPRSGLAACVYEGSVYALGGFSAFGGGYKRTAARYVPDSGTGRWEVVDSMFSPRTGLGAAVADGRLYAVGGKFFGSLPSVEYFDGDSWTTDTAALYTSRSGHALVGYESLLVAIGGSNHNSYLSSVELLDPDACQWVEVEGLRAGRAYHGGAVVGNRIVVIGGYTHMTVLGSVEWNTAILPGIAENSSVGLRTISLPSVVRARSRIVLSPGCSAWLFDNAGRLVRRGSGSLEFDVNPGVYFVRLGSGATHKLAVPQ